MRMLKMSLLAVLAVLSLAPTVALALPPQCDDYCWMWTCEDTCAVHNRWTTCGAEYPTWCNPSASDEPTDASASLNSEKARQRNYASQVCSEENRATEQSATVGSLGASASPASSEDPGAMSWL